MPNVLFTDDLITRARDTAGVPNTEVTGTDDPAVIRYLNEVFLSKIVPRLLKVKQSYFTRNTIITLVSGQSKYRFPSRAIALKLDNLVHRSATDANAGFNWLTKINHEDRYRVVSRDSIPRFFYVEGNYLVLVPEQSSTFSGFIEAPYFIRPGRLVLTEECRQVTAVDTALKTVTLDDLPATFTAGETYDVHCGTSGGEPKCIDLSVASVTATTIVFNEAIDGSVFGSHPVEVGDWVALADQACIPAIPRDFDDALVQACVVKLTEAQGDSVTQLSMAMLEDKIRDAVSSSADRVESKPDRIRFPSVLRCWR